MVNANTESFKFKGNERLVHKRFGFSCCAKVLSRSFDYDREVPFYVIQVYDKAANNVSTQIHDMEVLEHLFETEPMKQYM
jgi:hypothetical protein